MTMSADLPTLTKALFYAESFEAGILPVQPHEDATRALAQLTPLEARAAKRKFRKQWRRIMKKELREASGKRATNYVKSRYGHTQTRPASYEARNRKLAVYAQIIEHAEAAIARTVPA